MNNNKWLILWPCCCVNLHLINITYIYVYMYSFFQIEHQSHVACIQYIKNSIKDHLSILKRWIRLGSVKTTYEWKSSEPTFVCESECMYLCVWCLMYITLIHISIYLDSSSCISKEIHVLSVIPFKAHFILEIEDVFRYTS